MKPEVLVMAHRRGWEQAGFASLRKDFEMHYAPDVARADVLIAERGSRIRAVVTTGSFGLTAGQMDRMPKLEFVQTRGMGHEKIDFDAARERNVVVANSPSVNFFSVAEHAMALLLTLVRDIPSYNESVHQGRYAEARGRPSRPLIHARRSASWAWAISGRRSPSVLRPSIRKSATTIATAGRTLLTSMSAPWWSWPNGRTY